MLSWEMNKRLSDLRCWNGDTLTTSKCFTPLQQQFINKVFLNYNVFFV